MDTIPFSPHQRDANYPVLDRGRIVLSLKSREYAEAGYLLTSLLFIYSMANSTKELTISL